MVRDLHLSPRVWMGADPGTRWDHWDRLIMMGLVWVEADICTGCGGFLTEELVHDHGFKVHEFQCVKCQTAAVRGEQNRKMDEFMDGLPGADIPAARKTFMERIPLPTTKIE